MTNKTSLYPSIESLMVSEVVTGKRTVDEITETYLANPKTQKNNNIKNIYANLNNQLDQFVASVTENDLSDIRNKENQIVLSNQNKDMVTQNTMYPNNMSNMTLGNTLRQVMVIKDDKTSLGLGLVFVDNCHYICYVETNSPASYAQIRFGDQIVRINTLETAGMDGKKIVKYISNLPIGPISFLIRNRPLQKVYQLHKNEHNQAGISFRNGCIDTLVKDSSAARNGVPINHKIVEVNYQNVIGLSDLDILRLLKETQGCIYLSLMKIKDYKELISGVGKKKMKTMDHSFMTL